MQVEYGQEATFESTFHDVYGNPVDPDTICVDLWDSNKTKLVDDGVPERIATGRYRFTYLIPEGPRGLWRIEWQAVVQGTNAFGQEYFDVAPLHGLTPSEEILHSQLRSRIGEVSRLPLEDDGSDTMFRNTDIANMIAYTQGDINAATLEGWKRKAANLSRLIDVSESGSDRLLSQRFRQAKAMLDFWGGVVGGSDLARAEALSGRVVGSVINLKRVEDPTPGTPFSGYVDHIREYPTKRLVIPAILA